MKDKNIIFSIVDHGYGIPPEAHQKLFTKFYRVNNPKAVQEIGTGLGLAYVKEIATYHNGSIFHGIGSDHRVQIHDYNSRNNF